MRQRYFFSGLVVLLNTGVTVIAVIIAHKAGKRRYINYINNLFLHYRESLKTQTKKRKRVLFLKFFLEIIIQLFEGQFF